MKKQVEVSTKSTAFIEVDVPTFYKWCGMYYMISDDAVLTVAGTFLSTVNSVDKVKYGEEIHGLLKYGPPVISQKEFETAFNNTIKCLTEQYQLSMNMNLDPNTPQAAEGQEQTTEQVAAQESASQDAAMEVSEATETVTTTESIEETGG